MNLLRLTAAFPLRLSKKTGYYILGALVVIAFTLLIWLAIGGRLGVDWRTFYYPGARLALSGQNPYNQDQFLMAPWVLALFIPLSLLPQDLGFAILLVLGFAAYAFAAIKLKAKPLGVAAIMLSPFVLHNLINGNVDWLAVLGFILPPQVGLFFVALKPQIGIAMIVYWAYLAFAEKRFIKTFTPFIAATLLSFLIFGFWPMRMPSATQVYNASFWPGSIPFGLVLLVISIRTRNEHISQAISPFLSPHVMFHSYVTVLYALAPYTLELVVASASSWLLVAYLGITKLL